MVNSCWTSLSDLISFSHSRAADSITEAAAAGEEAAVRRHTAGPTEDVINWVQSSHYSTDSYRTSSTQSSQIYCLLQQLWVSQQKDTSRKCHMQLKENGAAQALNNSDNGAWSENWLQKSAALHFPLSHIWIFLRDGCLQEEVWRGSSSSHAHLLPLI